MNLVSKFRADSAISSVQDMALELGVKEPNSERVDVCITGLELCVLNDDDVVYILRDAVDEKEAHRRLRTRISTSPVYGY